jgi:hypothetical protein
MNFFTQPWEESGCIVTSGESQVASLACIWPLLSNIINVAIAFSGVIALVFILLSGIKIITANGNSEQLSEAKKTLTFAIIGFVFIVLSFTIFNGVFTLLGIDQNVVGPNDNGGLKVDPAPLR